MGKVSFADRILVYDANRLNTYESLFVPSGDWNLEKRFLSTQCYKHKECYALDRAHASDINTATILDCLDALKWSFEHSGDRSRLEKLVCEKPVEGHFFLRVLDRKKLEIGKSKVKEMKPDFTDERLRNIWNHTVQVMSAPPVGEEFSQLKKQWEHDTTTTAYNQLFEAFNFDQQTTGNSLERFTRSHEIESEIALQKNSVLFKICSSLFSAGFFISLLLFLNRRRTA